MYDLKCRVKLMSMHGYTTITARLYIGIATVFRLTLRDNVSSRTRGLHFVYSGFA